MQGLVVDAVSKSYGPVAALMALSFSIKPGQFTALLGPNGAGKTTLFQVLSGLFRPDTGSITIDGIRMDQNPAKALSRLGVIFQQQSLDVSMSVEQNLRFHAALHGLPRSVANERIAAGLNQFALAEQSGRLVRELSGGNKRKVELIRAMLHQPAILLADEATVGLDPASRAGLLKEVHHCVATQQCAVLWSTHLVAEAQAADRVLVLHQGKIIADGSPDGVTLALGGDNLEDGFMKATALKPTGVGKPS